MPAKPRWLLPIPSIIDAPGQFSAPVVDRATGERLFGLRRRRAIDLMPRFGGYQALSAMLVDRMALIEALRRIVHRVQHMRMGLSAPTACCNSADVARDIPVNSDTRLAAPPPISSAFSATNSRPLAPLR